MTDAEREAMLEVANSGDETEDQKTDRLALGIETDEEIAKRIADGGETDDERIAREAEETAGTKGSKSVPHARFNEVVMQRNYHAAENDRLTKELAAAKAGKASSEEEQEPGFDYDEAEERYIAAIGEGDKKAAKAIRREVNDQLKADTEASVLKMLNLDERLEQQSAQLTETQMVKQFTDRIEETFPQFRKGSKEFDSEMVSDVIEMHRGYMAGGMKPSVAIEKATRIVSKANGIDISKPPEAGLSEGAGKSAAERAAAARKKGNETNNRQPPKTVGGQPGNKVLDPDEIDVEQLTDEQFDALPEATKKKLRGDDAA